MIAQREPAGEMLTGDYDGLNQAGITIPEKIIKRDGRVVSFDIGRIERAMARCFASLARQPDTSLSELARRTVNIIAAQSNGDLPTVEGVQDIVEMVLQAAGEFEAAKHYILYRAGQAKKREQRPIPEEVRHAFQESDSYFPTPLQRFQFFDKYSRFNYELGRRETWIETVNRSVDFLYELAGARLPAETYERLRQSILAMHAMPSMRLLAMAGPAARRNNVTIYNCSYQPVESIDSFVEALIISMSGCGVGYSVESQYVENFPRIKRQTGAAPATFVVEDSAEGWAEALRFGLETWFEGGDARFDLSLLRPAGAPLKTKGGRASGPEPLRVMLEFIRSRILKRQGSFLRPIDAHDMMCAVGNAAVSGGVRRTAMLALFDYDDDEMRLCKSGDFERENSQRWNANNSAIFDHEHLTQAEFVRRFLEMVESGRGEPGIFNRRATIEMRPQRRKAAEFGTNPSLRRGTLIYTSEGIVPIETLEGKRFFVRNLHGNTSLATCFLSGRDKPLYRIVLRGNHTYYATAEHRWPVVQPDGSISKLSTSQLEAGMYFPLIRPSSLDFGHTGDYGDGLLAGWLLGSGWLMQDNGSGKMQAGLLISEHDYAEGMGDRLTHVLHRLGCAASFAPQQQQGTGWYELQTSATALQAWAERFEMQSRSGGLPRSVWHTASEEFRKGLIDGLFSSDGTIGLHQQPDCPVIGLVSSHQRLIEDVATLLGFYGIQTSIRQSVDTNDTSRRPGSHDRTATRYELNIAGADDIAHFRALFQLSSTAQAERLMQQANHPPTSDGAARAIKVLSVEQTALCEDVWDISVFDETHCFQLAHCITGNCGEIVLRPWEFCNLTAAVARSHDTFESLREKVEVATIIGTIQSLATSFPGLRPVWQHNCEEERLLGVDITGQMDSPIAQDAHYKERLRQLAIEVNRETAHALGINQSAAITCVKPSGNCRPWYSLTSTSAGLLTLQELFADHPDDVEWAEIQSMVYALQGDTQARISRTYNNGVSPTIRIRMNYGLVVESTPQHRWFVAYRYRRGKGLQPVNEWIMAADLCLDDVLDIHIGAYAGVAHAPLATVKSLALKMRGNAVPIRQPGEMNEDLAWLLGYLWGDGCLSPGGFRIRFMDSRQENLLKTQRILHEQFGLATTIHAASEKRHAQVLEVASVYLWHWLIRNNVFRYFHDQIDLLPQCVRASARNDIIAFLAGLLDSDGWSGLTHETRAGRFTLSTSDRAFAQHIQDVSWAVGIPVGCSLNDTGDNLQNRREMYLLTGCVHILPDAFEVLLRNSTKLQATASLPEFTRWEWETESKCNHIGKITEIMPGDCVPTYDIEVEGNHWFYAGAVKSHNSSQMLNCSSGLHARWAPYYIRNIRVAASSPIFKVLQDAGVPMDPENGQSPETANTWVIHFPVKSPPDATTRNDRSAVEQCEFWLQNKLAWTEHNPSVTITYRPEEVIDLIKWVWEHRDVIGGMAFLPAFDANYAQMPYVEITSEEYERLVAAFPAIDFSKIYRYEDKDLTNAAQELACTAGNCEVDF